MWCVFTGPILSWSQAQLLMEGKKTRQFFCWDGTFLVLLGAEVTDKGCDGADLSVWLRSCDTQNHRIFIFINSSFRQVHSAAFVNISSHSSICAEVDRLLHQVILDRITWVLIQHFKTSISVKQTHLRSLFMTRFGLTDAVSYKLTNWSTERWKHCLSCSFYWI